MLMITREGMETALLMGTLLFQIQSLRIIVGATIGTASAAFVAWLTGQKSRSGSGWQS